jgi:hypothetical protein
VKCPHPWHFNFSWLGTPYRFSLKRCVGRDITSKTEAEALAEKIRTEIRAGTFDATKAGATTRVQHTPPDVVSFETFARLFIERYSKDRGKASWRDDEYMTRQLVSFRVVDDTRLGDRPVQVITEDDLEAFIKHLVTLGRAASTRNHYVQLIKAMSRWAVRKLPQHAVHRRRVGRYPSKKRGAAPSAPRTGRGGTAVGRCGIASPGAHHRRTRNVLS